MKVFVDVGAHFGEGLVEVLKPNYGFDKIICVEPSSYAQSKIKRFRDRRIVIKPWGAWSASGSATLHSAGTIGASVYREKPRQGENSELIELRDIRKFFDEEFTMSDVIYLKINAEGAEYEILNRLLKNPSNQWRIESLLLSLDIKKIPSLRYLESKLNKLIEDRNIRSFSRESSDPSEAIRIWLRKECASRRVFNLVKWFMYFLSVPTWYHLRGVLRGFIPKRVWLFMALRWGPNKLVS